MKYNIISMVIKVHRVSIINNKIRKQVNAIKTF